MEDYYLIYLPDINHFVPRRFDDINKALRYVKSNYPESFRDLAYRIDYCKHVRGSMA